MNTIELKTQELKREYQKKWRSKNKNKVKEYNKRYWEKKAKKLLDEKEGE